MWVKDKEVKHRNTCGVPMNMMGPKPIHTRGVVLSTVPLWWDQVHKQTHTHPIPTPSFLCLSFWSASMHVYASNPIRALPSFISSLPSYFLLGTGPTTDIDEFNYNIKRIFFFLVYMIWNTPIYLIWWVQWIVMVLDFKTK